MTSAFRRLEHRRATKTLDRSEIIRNRGSGRRRVIRSVAIPVPVIELVLVVRTLVIILVFVVVIILFVVVVLVFVASLVLRSFAVVAETRAASIASRVARLAAADPGSSPSTWKDSSMDAVDAALSTSAPATVPSTRAPMSSA